MSIVVNMEKAKDIWREKWRGAHKPLLEDLDVQFMRAVESGNTTEQNKIASEKQALRDVTLTDLSTAETPTDIRQIWPTILGDRL